MKYSFSKILIIQTAFIGDVILATALIEKLSGSYPGARIDFLLRKGNEGILQGHPKINKVLIWDKKKGKLSNLFRLIGHIRKEKYDLVVNLQRFFSSGLLTALSDGKTTVGFSKNPLSAFFSLKIPHRIGKEDKIIHEVDRNLSLIQRFTDDKQVKPHLYPSKQDFEVTQAYKKDIYICVAPGSVWFTKTFPKEKWIDFIDSVSNTVKVYLIGGPSDKDLCMDIQKNVKRSVEDLSGRMSFLESAALMKDALMNYVNDSGPMHIASAINAPVCAVYCSTVPYFGFGPLSNASHIVQMEGKLSCRPCGLHGHKACPEGHFKCAHEIKKGQLLELLTL